MSKIVWYIVIAIIESFAALVMDNKTGYFYLAIKTMIVQCWIRRKEIII